MKLSLAFSLLLAQAFESQAFAPLSSFTSFQSSQSFQKDGFSIPTTRSRKGSEMRMMFDQLSNAINEVTKNFGPRKKYVLFV